MTPQSNRRRPASAERRTPRSRLALALLAATALGGAAAFPWIAPLVGPAATAALAAAAHAQPAPARQPLYYRDPAGGADFSATPKRNAQGRDYIPVYDDAEPAGSAEQPPKPAQAASTSPAAGGVKRGRILYYRNPMGLADTSPVPKKDAMGMDYVPVYEDEASQPAGTVTISPERVQILGVRTAPVTQRVMARSIRAVGTVAVDERRLVVVAPRFEGWIERLLVDQTGQSVRRGQKLFEVYSPELVATAQEAGIARRAQADMAQAEASVRSSTAGIAASAAARLRNFGITGSGPRFTLASPIDGVVLQKTAVQGMRFAPGDSLYRIADLSTIWVLADVFERDLGQVQPGENASVVLTAYPGRHFSGRLTFVYPTLNAATRTGRVRIELANPDLLLKPDMYATVEIAADMSGSKVTAVPDSAVLDSGTHQIVLVERGTGRYEPRPVTTGTRADGFVEIRSGLATGEKVVVGANFLIDAESNLRAALQAFTADKQQDGSK